MVLLEHLFVGLNVPLGGKGQSGVAFFDSLQIYNFLVKFLDLGLNLLQLFGIWTFSVALKEGNVGFTERHALVIFENFFLFGVRLGFLLVPRLNLLRLFFLCHLFDFAIFQPNFTISISSQIL